MSLDVKNECKVYCYVEVKPTSCLPFRFTLLSSTFEWLVLGSLGWRSSHSRHHASKVVSVVFSTELERISILVTTNDEASERVVLADLQYCLWAIPIPNGETWGHMLINWILEIAGGPSSAQWQRDVSGYKGKVKARTSVTRLSSDIPRVQNLNARE